MFIKKLFNYRGEQTQGECVVRANGPDTSQNWLLQGTLTDTDHRHREKGFGAKRTRFVRLYCRSKKR